MEEKKEIESALKEVTSDKIQILVEKKQMEKTLGEIATKDDFTLAKRYPRTIYLKMAFVIGALLKEEKLVGKALCESLLKHAAAQRTLRCYPSLK